jgi:predicted NACHT family NTPase
VVLSEPGGGKTRLTQMLAKDLALATQADPEAPVPVILKSRSWGREFGSIAEGVRKEIESFAPGTAATGVVEEDLSAGRFVVLLDGLDEAPRAEANLLRAEPIRVATRMGTRLIATCRKQDYRPKMSARRPAATDGAARAST